ncbi:MAG: hypothetical protein C0596_11210 [Marinilabiliales bacterium]|nr:MAG: hypothetical protein C0596_11210 [Marinilabiliales bacterium]
MKIPTILTIILLYIFFACNNPVNNETESTQSNNDTVSLNLDSNDTILNNDTLIKIKIDSLNRFNPEEQESIILYSKNENNSFQYYLDLYPNCKTIAIAELSVNASDIIWSRDLDVFYFITKSSIISISSDNNDKNYNLPYGYENLAILEAWVDEDSKNIRIAFEFKLNKSNPEHIEKAAKLDKDFIAAPGCKFISILELQENGRWDTIIEKPVEYNPYGSSLVYLYEYINYSDKFSTLSKTKKSTTCIGFESHDYITGDDAKTIVPNYEDSDYSAIMRIQINNDYDLYPTVIWGDSPHFSTPIYFFDNNSGELTEINIHYKNLSIQKTAKKLIISQEHSNSQAIVFETDNISSKMIYDNCTNVVIIK